MPLGLSLSCSLQLGEEKKYFGRREFAIWNFTQSFSLKFYLSAFAIWKRIQYLQEGGTYKVEGHLKYRKNCYGETSPQMQQIKLLMLKSNRACHLHYGKFGVVPLKAMELQQQKSDLTDQDWACKRSFFNLRKTWMQYIIYYPPYKLLKST